MEIVACEEKESVWWYSLRPESEWKTPASSNHALLKKNRDMMRRVETLNPPTIAPFQFEWDKMAGEELAANSKPTRVENDGSLHVACSRKITVSGLDTARSLVEARIAARFGGEMRYKLAPLEGPLTGEAG